MRLPRIFVAQEFFRGAEFEAPQATLHYVRDVLRLRTGDPLRVFNGDGREFEANVSGLERKSLRITVLDELAPESGSALCVHLGIGLSRGERMDWIFQKATELGAESITPLLLERCAPRPDEQRVAKRLQHWSKITVSACEQCGRRRLPRLQPLLELETWLSRDTQCPGLVLHPGHPGTPVALDAPAQIRLLVGAEGGLSEREYQQALDAGFKPWSLGPRTLRTETAPLAALSILQFLWGDMR